MGMSGRGRLWPCIKKNGVRTREAGSGVVCRTEKSTEKDTGEKKKGRKKNTYQIREETAGSRGTPARKKATDAKKWEKSFGGMKKKTQRTVPVIKLKKRPIKKRARCTKSHQSESKQLQVLRRGPKGPRARKRQEPWLLLCKPHNSAKKRRRATFTLSETLYC